MFDGKGAISSRLFLRSLEHFPRILREYLPFYLMSQDMLDFKILADKGMRPPGWLRLTRSVYLRVRPGSPEVTCIPEQNSGSLKKERDGDGC